MKRITRCSVALILAAGVILAQKPKSQKEVDALRAIQMATTPDERMKAVDDLMAKFADTEFKAWAYEIAAEAAQSKNDSAKAQIYAGLALEADPHNFQSMIVISSELASGTRENDLDKEEKLAKSEKYAKQAIETINAAPASTLIPEPQWSSLKKDATGDAHRNLGMVASLRKKYDVAIAEFKQATEIAASPDPANFIRLAAAYTDAGQPDNALTTLTKVPASPPLQPFIDKEKKRAEQAKASKK